MISSFSLQLNITLITLISLVCNKLRVCIDKDRSRQLSITLIPANYQVQLYPPTSLTPAPHLLPLSDWPGPPPAPPPFVVWFLTYIFIFVCVFVMKMKAGPESGLGVTRKAGSVRVLCVCCGSGSVAM